MLAGEANIESVLQGYFFFQPGGGWQSPSLSVPLDTSHEGRLQAGVHSQAGCQIRGPSL